MEILTQLVLFWNERCTLTLDSVTRDLVKSMTYIATALGIFWARSRRRKFPSPRLRAIDPAIRARYTNFHHRPDSELLRTLRTTRTPLADLIGLTKQLKCAVLLDGTPRHAVLENALTDLVMKFLTNNFSSRTSVVVNYYVM